MTRNEHGYSRRSILKKGAITTGTLALGGIAASGTASIALSSGLVVAIL